MLYGLVLYDTVSSPIPSSTNTDPTLLRKYSCQANGNLGLLGPCWGPGLLAIMLHKLAFAQTLSAAQILMSSQWQSLSDGAVLGPWP